MRRAENGEHAVFVLRPEQSIGLAVALPAALGTHVRRGDADQAIGGGFDGRGAGEVTVEDLAEHGWCVRIRAAGMRR